MGTDQVAVVSRFVLAFVFLGAGTSKLVNRRSFVNAVLNYRLVTEPAAEFIGKWLPVLEIVSGIALVSGVMEKFTALIVGSLLILFILAVVVNLVRGRPIDCGCVGASAGRASSTISLWTVARNIVLLAMAGLVALRPLTALSLDLPWRQPNMPEVPLGDALADLSIATSALVFVVFVPEVVRLLRLTNALGRLEAPVRRG